MQLIWVIEFDNITNQRAHSLILESILGTLQQCDPKRHLKLNQKAAVQMRKLGFRDVLDKAMFSSDVQSERTLPGNPEKAQ